MDLFGASHRWGGEQIKIYINHVTQPLSSAKIGTFSPEISNFCYGELQIKNAF